MQYVEVLTSSISTVFLVAALVTVVGFVLALVLEERPLRDAVAAGSGVGESFAVPPDGDSLSLVSHWLWALLSRESRRRLLERVAREAGVNLSAAAVWLLARFHESSDTTTSSLARTYKADIARLDAGVAELRDQGLVATDSGELTQAGTEVLERLVAANRVILTRLLADWSPDEHRDLSEHLRRVARDLAGEVPAR
jgi:DNA-binding MarR family transcriptional regulator